MCQWCVLPWTIVNAFFFSIFKQFAIVNIYFKIGLENLSLYAILLLNRTVQRGTAGRSTFHMCVKFNCLY